MRRHTWIVLGVVLVCIGSWVFFPMFSRYRLRQETLMLVEQVFGPSVRYQELQSEEELLVLKNIQGDATGLSESTLSAETLRVHYPSQGAPLKVVIEGLQVRLDAYAAPKSFTLPWGTLLASQGVVDIIVQDSYVYWRELGKDAEVAAQLDIDGHFSPQATHGKMHLQGGQAALSLELALEQGEGALFAQATAVPWAFLPFSIGDLGITVEPREGVVDGKMKWQLSGARCVAIDGIATVMGAKVRVPSLELELELPHLRCQGLRSLEGPEMKVEGQLFVRDLGQSAAFERLELSELKGRVGVNEEEGFHLAISTPWHQGAKVKSFQLDVGGSHVEALWENSSKKTASARWSLAAQGERELCLEAMEAGELELVRRCAALSFSIFQPWKLYRGTLSGRATFGEKGLTLHRCHLENVLLAHVHSPLRGECRSFTAKIDFQQRRLEGALDFTGAKVSMGQKTFAEEGVAALRFSGGHLKYAELKAELPDQRGRWRLLSDRDTQVELWLDGKELAHLYPSDFQKAAAAVFKNDALHAQGAVIRKGMGWQIEGKGAISGPNGTEEAVASCLLMPSLDIPKLVEMQLCCSKVPLERYLSPLLPERFDLHAFGFADIDMRLRNGTYTVAYDLAGAGVENTHLRIDVETLSGEGHGTRPGVFSWSPNADGVLVHLPLYDAKLHDRDHELHWDGIYADVEIAPYRLEAKHLEASVAGVAFGGHVTIEGDAWGAQPLLLQWRLQNASGALSTFRQLLSHFDGADSLVHTFPVEGIVSLDSSKESGGEAWFTDSLQVAESHFHGKLLSGCWEERTKHLSLVELSSTIAYAYPQNELSFKDIRGTLSVGEPEETVEEFSLVGDHIQISDYPHGAVSFDVWCGDHKRDLVRIAGHAERLAILDPSLWDCHFNLQDTHFGNVHPKKLELTLDGWQSVHAFSMDSEFALDRVFRDFLRLSKTGILPLHPKVLREMHRLEAVSGKVSSKLTYDGPGQLFAYQTAINDLLVNDTLIERFAFNGRLTGDHWIVDQLRGDDLSFSADVSRKQNLWKVNFLGIRCARAAMLGLDGDFDVETGIFDARVNLLEANLQQLSHWSASRDWAQALNPTGELRAQGTARVVLLPSPNWWHLDADLRAQLREAAIVDLRLQDVRDVAVHYDSDAGIEVAALSTKLVPPIGKGRAIALDFSRITFHPVRKHLVLSDAHFEMPTASLGWCLSRLGQVTTRPIVGVAAALLAPSLQGAPILGSFSADVDPQSASGYFDLQAPLALGQATNYQLKGGLFDYDPYELRAELSLECLGEPLRAVLKNKCPISPYGELLFFSHSSAGEAKAPLTLLWEKDAGGFLIKEAQGTLFGLTMDMKGRRDRGLRSSEFLLEGSMHARAKDMLVLVPDELRKPLSRWGIDAQYQLNGTWRVEGLLPDRYSFDGQVHGQDIVVQGCLLDRCEGALSLSPRFIKMTHFVLSDVAGTIAIPELSLTRVGRSQWLASIPELKGSHLSPGSLRYTEGRNRRKKKELSLSDVTLTGISGDLHNLNSFVCEGSLSFQLNTRSKSRKGLGGLTTGLMAQVGLEADLVLPQSGSIDFEVGEGQVVVKQLRDMYSKGKFAKFYLPKGVPPATVTSDGVLDMTVRMKPTQSLLKLTDKVTLHIGGTVRQPTYVVQQ